jgi:isocitrate dehydrogenase kinase/phosphatase
VSSLSCCAQTLTAEDAKIINIVFAENEACQEKIVQYQIAVDSCQSALAQKDTAISHLKFEAMMARTEAALRNQQNIQLNDDIKRYQKVIKQKNWANIKTAIGTSIGSFAFGVGLTSLIFLLK